MPRLVYSIFEFHLRTAWKSYPAIAKDNTVSVSTTNGESAFVGLGLTPRTSKSSTTIRRIDMPRNKHAPVHPGEILTEEFLKPLELSEYRLAKGLCVPARRINEIVHGKRAITADTALRLGRFFRNSARFWLNLQTAYDLQVEADRLGPKLVRDVEILRRAG
jgi:addiction module HigA family antidote